MPNKIEVSVSFPQEAIPILETLPQAIRYLGLAKAFKAAGNVVKDKAKALCPPPGYVGDKPGLKPLRDTIAVAERQYEHALVILVGPQYPAGAHGHLVEFGHRKFLWGKETQEHVKAKPFMRPAAFETLALQESTIVGILQGELDKLSSSSFT